MAVIGLRVQCACGGWLEVDQTQFGRTNICPHCGKQVIVVHPAPAGLQKRPVEPPPAPWREPPPEYRSPWAESPPYEESSIPWLHWRTIGFFAAIWRTIKGVLFHPGRTFWSVPAKGSTGPHTRFLLLISAAFFAITLYSWRPLFEGYAQIIAGLTGKADLVGSLDPKVIWGIAGVFWALAIVSILAQTWVNAAVIHVLLMATGSGEAGFRTTYIVCLYTTAAVMPLVFVPWVGLVIAALWWTFSTAAGLRAAHRSGIFGPALSTALTAGLNVLSLLALVFAQKMMLATYESLLGTMQK